MFGLLLPSRPVLAPPTTALAPTQYAIDIPRTPPFNHIVVFLLPGESLPAGTAATIHIRAPPAAAFSLLGAISNDKQSAMFKISPGPAAAADMPATREETMLDDATLLPVADTAGAAAAAEPIVLGLSIEPLDGVQEQLRSLRAGGASSTRQPAVQRPGLQGQQQQNQAASYTGGGDARGARLDTGQVNVLAQRIIKDAFDFLGGFAQGPPGNEVVPLKGFQEWWAKFDKKVELDGEWLERKIMQD